jgi:hypothetical protein
MCVLPFGAGCVLSVNDVVVVGQKKRERLCMIVWGGRIQKAVICDIIALLKATFFGVVMILIVRRKDSVGNFHFVVEQLGFFQAAIQVLTLLVIR